MFRLRDLKNGLWQIHKQNGPAFEGLIGDILPTAVKLGIPGHQVERASAKMITEGWDYCDFTKSGNILEYKKGPPKK